MSSTTIDIVHAILFILHETRRYTFKFWKKDTLDISENCRIHENADTIIFPKRKLYSQNCITTAVEAGRGEQSGIVCILIFIGAARGKKLNETFPHKLYNNCKLQFSIAKFSASNYSWDKTYHISVISFPTDFQLHELYNCSIWI